MENKVLNVVKCPQCGKMVPWAETQAFRPFCSERCQLIDFGDWADEQHYIPGSSLDLSDDTDEV